MTLYERYKKMNDGEDNNESVYDRYLRVNGIQAESRANNSNKDNYLSEIQNSDKLSKYASVMSNSDYADKSMYKGTIPKEGKLAQIGTVIGNIKNVVTGNGIENLYNYINNNGNNPTDEALGRYAPSEVMTDDEKNVFNYLYNSGDYSQAESFYKEIEDELLKRSRELQNAKAQDNIKTGGDVAGASAFSVLPNAVSGLSQVSLGGMSGLVSAINGDGFAEGWNDVAKRDYLGSYADAVRGHGANIIAENTKSVDDSALGILAKNALGIENIPSWLYQTGMSVADSAFSRLYGGLLGNGIGEAMALTGLGGTAARQKSLEVLENGGTDEEAFYSGIASGAIEAITEKIGYDNFFDVLTGTAKTSGQEIAKALAQSFLSEGAEEATSDILNLVTDTIILDLNDEGTQSEMLRNFAEYSKTMSNEDAMKEAIKDFAKNVASDFLGGALSGIASGSTASAVNYINNVKTGAEINRNERTEDLKSYAIERGREDLAKTLENNPSKGNIGFVQSTLVREASESGSSDDVYYAVDKAVENLTPKTGLTDKKGNVLHLTDIEWDGDSPKFVTKEGTYEMNEVNVTDSTRSLVNVTENVPKNVRKTFIDNYNGDNLGDYSTAFAVAYDYGLKGDSKGMERLVNSKALTMNQAMNIYSAALSSKDSSTSKLTAMQNRINERKKVVPNKKVRAKIKDDVVDYNNITENQKNNVHLAEALAKALGVNVEFFDSTKEKGSLSDKNGAFLRETNTIMLDINATNTGNDDSTNAIITTMSHELTHWSKQSAPELYDNFRREVLIALADEFGSEVGEDLTMSDMVRISRAKYEGLTDEQIEDELVARACENMLSNSEYAKEALGRMSVEAQKTFGEKVKEFIENILNAIKEIMGRFDSKSTEYKLLAKNAETLNELQKEWDAMIKEASENVAYLTESGVEIVDDGASAYFSPKTFEDSEYYQNRDKMAMMLAERLGRTKTDAEKYLDDVYEAYKYYIDNFDRFGYEENELSAFKSNAEYGGSLDMSTICDKRRLYTGTYSAILKELKNAVLTPSDLIDIRNRLIEANKTVTCGFCYVEGSRLRLGMYSKLFLEKYKRLNPSWVPTMYDLTTPDGVENMRKNHPEAYERYEYFFNHYGRINEEDKAKLPRGKGFGSQGKPKLYQTRTSYKHEILDKFGGKGARVEDKNINGGFRMWSFSDFEFVHTLDVMQAVLDLSAVGLCSQAYTKVPAFARAFGNTGIKINLSLVAEDVDENGNLKFNDREGMNHNEAFDIRNSFPKNVGCVCVVFTDEQLMAALKDSRIDYILPFHRSQLKKEYYHGLGLPSATIDATNDQVEKYTEKRYNANGKEIKAKDNLIMPNSYWFKNGNVTPRQNAEEYLRLCAEDGRIPKFANLLVDNHDDTYSLPEGFVGDNYYKLIIDFKMFDNEGNPAPQMPVAPNFEMDYIRSKMDEYDGAHKEYPVDYDVVNSYVKDYKESGRAYSSKETGEYSYSKKVTDESTLSFLNGQKTIKTYRSMQLINGKLYPPMAAKVGKEFEDASELGKWEEAVEHPELVDKDGQFKLQKGGDSSKKGMSDIKAAYNPYMHSSDLPINDQFSGAYARPNLVTVECEVPVSESGSGYHADKAKDSVGWHSWHTGPVAKQLRKQKGIERRVFLSRWLKPVRILSDSEVADKYKELVGGTEITIPDNVVTPSLLKALKEKGVPISTSGVVYSSKDSLEHRAMSHFGVTDKFNIAGYMLSDGTMLDFSGQHWLEGWSKAEIEKWKNQNDIRQVDHEDIYEVFPENDNGGDNRLKFMKRGNIRMSPEAPGINILSNVEPTKEQYAKLKEYIRDYAISKFGNFFIDIEGKGHEKVVYTGRVSADRVINDIKDYYKTGIVPKGTEGSLSEFYSVKDDKVFSWKDSEGYLHLDAEDTLSLDDFESYLNKTYGRNARIEAHLRKLNQKIKDNVMINQTKLNEFARKLKNEYGLSGSLKQITEQLREVYMKVTDIDAFEKASKDITGELLGTVKSKYIDETLQREAEQLKKELKSYTFSLSGEQRNELRYTYGDNWSTQFLGKATFRKTGVPLDSIWQELMDRYPQLFTDVSEAEEGVKLAEVIDRIYSGDYFTRESVSNKKDLTESLLMEIREASWSISDNLTMAEKYAEAMSELREKIRVAKAEVRENAQKQMIIAKILERENKLGLMLRKNDKDNHIPDVLKAPLKTLFETVNVESRVTPGAMANNFTALAKALEDVSVSDDKIADLTMYFDSEGYFVQNIREIADELQKKVDKVTSENRMGTSINDLSIDSLKKLNEALAAVSTAVRNYDRVLATDTAQRISDRSSSSMSFLKDIDPKGPEKSRILEVMKTFLAWDNVTPVYGYDRFGQGGKDTFKGIMDGEDQLTRNSKVIIDFAKDTFTGDEADKWSKEINLVEIDGKEYPITTAQIMSLYCLNKRETAKQHLYTAKNVYGEDIEGQGIVIGAIKGESQKTTPIKVKKSDVEMLTGLLSDRQKEVADRLQSFMSTTCSDWGNYVTMKRFGIMQFGEENYFPMTVFRENSASLPQEIPQTASIFKLLNMGFTKSLNERGNGALELESIFDIFTKHSSEMASYNAFALPILDAYKWFSYKEVGEKTESLKTVIRLAYGQDGLNFVINHLEDLNGKANPRTSLEQLTKTIIRNYKTAATAANMRVVLMQPTAYLRAMNEINIKYLSKAVNLKPSAIKSAVNEMNEKSELAMKKNGLGAFDANVSRTIESQTLQTTEVSGVKGAVEKALDVSMWAAGKADEITWGTLYKAVQLETKDKHPDVSGAEFDAIVNERFRDICYRTQVFDSINARSNLMRKKDIAHQVLTAFGSEPTLSYSMLSNEVFMYMVDARNGKAQSSWNRHASNIKRAFVSYMLTAVAVSAVAALPDWMRDDDEDKSFLETYFKNFGLNLLGDALGLLPYFRDVYSIMVDGYDPSRPDEEIIVSARKTLSAVTKAVEEGHLTYRAVYQSAKLFSQLTGVPFANVIRDVKALWNKTVGEVFGMKIE